MTGAPKMSSQIGRSCMRWSCRYLRKMKLMTWGRYSGGGTHWIGGICLSLIYFLVSGLTDLLSSARRLALFLSIRTMKATTNPRPPPSSSFVNSEHRRPQPQPLLNLRLLPLLRPQLLRWQPPLSLLPTSLNLQIPSTDHHLRLPPSYLSSLWLTFLTWPPHHDLLPCPVWHIQSSANPCRPLIIPIFALTWSLIRRCHAQKGSAARDTMHQPQAHLLLHRNTVTLAINFRVFLRL
jgi:hypothetical protein